MVNQSTDVHFIKYPPELPQAQLPPTTHQPKEQHLPDDLPWQKIVFLMPTFMPASPFSPCPVKERGNTEDSEDEEKSSKQYYPSSKGQREDSYKRE